MTPGERLARELLDVLQAHFVAHDLEAVLGLLDDPVVLFGSAAANVDRAQTTAYVTRLMAHPETVRWGWDQVLPVHESPDLLVVAVVGSVGFDDEEGRPDGPRDDFRLTCVFVLRDGAWRLRHFHGSVPQTG